MQHLDFIVWMILFPIMVSLTELIDSKIIRKKEYSKKVETNTGGFLLFIWILVGYLLF